MGTYWGTADEGVRTGQSAAGLLPRRKHCSPDWVKAEWEELHKEVHNGRKYSRRKCMMGGSIAGGCTQ